jgi:hypothetical protein
LVNYTPLDRPETNSTFYNVNPAMNNHSTSANSNVQIMNVLDMPQSIDNLEQFAIADNGLLEGLPGGVGIFDWGAFQIYFNSRFCFTHFLTPFNRTMGYILFQVWAITGRF